MDNIDADELDKIVAFVCDYADDVVNAAMNIVPRALPEEATKEKEKMQKMLGLN